MSYAKLLRTVESFYLIKSALKTIFLATQNAAKKWTMPIREWAPALSYNDTSAALTQWKSKRDMNGLMKSLPSPCNKLSDIFKEHSLIPFPAGPGIPTLKSDVINNRLTIRKPHFVGQLRSCISQNVRSLWIFVG